MMTLPLSDDDGSTLALRSFFEADIDDMKNSRKGHATLFVLLKIFHFCLRHYYLTHHIRHGISMGT